MARYPKKKPLIINQRFWISGYFFVFYSNPSSKSLNPNCFSMPYAIEKDAGRRDKFLSVNRTSSHRLNGTLVDDGINQPVVHCLGRRHEEVAIGVLLNPVKGLTGTVREFLVQTFLQVENFVGLNPDVAGLASGPTQGLVDHDP